MGLGLLKVSHYWQWLTSAAYREELQNHRFRVQEYNSRDPEVQKGLKHVNKRMGQNGQHGDLMSAQKISYLNPDGSQDTLNQAVLATRTMAVALGKLMENGQRITVKLKNPDSYYTLVANNKMVRCFPATAEEIENYV